MHDLLIHGTFLDGTRQSLAISAGTITELGTTVSGSAKEEIDVGSDLILPGWIDAHVHFNEPGRTEWEGLHTGSLALAAGGGTTFFDMPLNSTPPATSAAALLAKRALGEEKAHLDFALWGGLTPDALGQLKEMAHEGAIGFKAFMCHSGLDEYPASPAETLREGMSIAAELNLPVAVHAEIPHDVSIEGTDMAAWLASRPITFELEAIALALDLAAETGCALHIVHVTCPEGIDLVTAAKSRGVNVTVETCPHYLLLTDEDAIRIGAPAKCAPPLRSRANVAAMWDRVSAGSIDTIGSDHSPSSPDLKTGDDFFAIWGGVAGIQHGFPLLLDHSTRIIPQTSQNVAQRFRLPNKGRLAVGFDADFIVVSKNRVEIAAADLRTRHAISPYLGMMQEHQVTTTYLRGQPVSPETRGRFLRPK